MKIYNTETQEDFNALLEKLKNEGYHWWSGRAIVPDDPQLWERNKQNTVVYVEVDVNGDGVSYGTLSYAEDNYPDTPIEKYKAKKSLDELEDVPEELLEAVVKYSEIWNEKGLAGDYTDINETMYKYGIATTKIKKPTIGSQQVEVSSGFDEDGVFRSTYCTSIKSTVADNVNNPSHYTSGGIETLDYIKAKVSNYPSYAVGNIVKYVSRYEHKNGLEDLKKAQFYLNDLINEMESGEE
ncbi:DUF3310 domain-containing protein [Listeria seeligeri]|uniref:DUF3310 domain-containing protein n=1 Tax=Listeria seeligeri TaxID=1640 RepID=UPI002892B475|nr:DUF3310 domain-containing protein [Listeria seeligeri]